MRHLDRSDGQHDRPSHSGETPALASYLSPKERYQVPHIWQLHRQMWNQCYYMAVYFASIAAVDFNSFARCSTAFITLSKLPP